MLTGSNAVKIRWKLVRVSEGNCYSTTSYSGSETSTDVSTSSLENLSCTSTRQEPQGEETTELTAGLLHDAGGATSSIGGDDDDDLDAKPSAWNDSWIVTTTGQQLPLPQQQQQQQQESSSSSPGDVMMVDYRPVVVSANSLIRQLLQNSPQYSHLLADLAETSTVQSAGGTSSLQDAGRSSGSSPKSALRAGGGGRPQDGGRGLPDTPTTAASSTRSGAASSVNRRLINRSERQGGLV